MRTSTAFAYHQPERARGPFQNFYPWAHCVYLVGGTKSPIVAVTVTECSSHPNEGYWAWWSNEKNCFEFIWPSRLQVDMCFPYGSAAAEARGKGHLLPVTVTYLRDATPEEYNPWAAKKKS